MNSQLVQQDPAFKKIAELLPQAVTAMKEAETKLNAVTPDQALVVSKKYLVPANMVVIAVGDRAKIEAELRKLNLGAVEIRDAEGKPIS